MIKQEFKLEKIRNDRYLVVQVKNSLKHLVGAVLTEQEVQKLLDHDVRINNATVTIVPPKG